MCKTENGKNFCGAISEQHHRASVAVAVVQLGLGYERCSTAFSAVKWRQLLLPAFCLPPASTLSLPSPITVVVIVALRIVSTS